MPILTSMLPPRPWVTRSVLGPRPAADTAPGEPGDHLLGGLTGDVPVAAQPVPGAHLGHADHRDAEQVRLVIGDPGVLADHLADHLGALVLDSVEPGADGRLVAEVGLEHQAVCLSLTSDELEVSAERGAHPLLVLIGGAQRAPDGLDQAVHALVQQRQVQLQLAGEVLVEHRLADSGALRDLVHGSGVVPTLDEYLKGRVEKLPPPFVPRQPVAARPFRARPYPKPLSAIIVIVEADRAFLFGGVGLVDVEGDVARPGSGPRLL